MKGTSLAKLTFHPNVSAVLFNDCARGRQSETSATILPGVRRIGLPKTVEYCVQLIRGDASPFILNGEFHSLLLN